MTALDHLIGNSTVMRRLRATIATVAPTSLPVLIHGETGTGKELVAAAVHAESKRRGAFVAFNVCAIADSMFEDTLFGHVKGAYTGALRDAPGLLCEAHDGTTFFDEISGLPLGSQAKLLRAVETGVFRAVGALRDTRSDFRVVAATNENVDDLVDAGRFRADLAHRLRAVVLHIPSLDHRREDIEQLARHFAASGRVQGRGPVTHGAIRVLEDTAWPGNVRELRQVVETAALFAHDAIDERSIEVALSQRRGDATRATPTTSLERRTLAEALEESGGDVDDVARRMGVHRATVYRRMKRLGIDVPRVSSALLADNGQSASGARPSSHGPSYFADGAKGSSTNVSVA